MRASRAPRMARGLLFSGRWEDRMRRMGLLWVAAVIIAGGCSKAPEQPAGGTAAVGTGGSDARVKDDNDFVHDVALMNLAEIELSRMALDKATNPDVKAFAQRLVQDHTAVNTELTALAKSKDLKIPASAKPAQAALAKLSGPAFDKAFVALMVKEHEAAIALFEGESRDGRDAEVKEWAAKQLPALREHLTQAKSLKTKES